MKYLFVFLIVLLAIAYAADAEEGKILKDLPILMKFLAFAHIIYLTKIEKKPFMKNFTFSKCFYLKKFYSAIDKFDSFMKLKMFVIETCAGGCEEICKILRCLGCGCDNKLKSCHCGIPEILAELYKDQPADTPIHIVNEP